MSALDDLTAAAGAGSAPENMGVECVERVGAASAPEEEPPRKRARNADEPSLRRRVLDYKMAKLKNLRERVMEQLSELFYLQGGGNMMDYATWRKRPPAPALVAFLEARGLPELEALPATPPPAPHDEMVAAAKQEAYVAGRVAELARAGLWTERRLPRVLEPPRPKSHWDYLLEEMSWLAQDFAHERKWKKQAAKKCARAVQKHFQDKAMAAQKAEKAQELQLRKIAAFAAKEIRTFWSNVEKLVEWKRVRRVERARKEALEEQLSYIVDRSEKYSRQLAANLHRPAPADTPPSDEEFEPRGPSDDDEETIADAERTHTDTAAEIAALHRESRLDLCAILPPGYTPKAAGSDYSSAGEDSADDETTIAEQEKAERTDHAAEIADLEADAEMSVEELRKKYSGVPPSPPPGDNATESQSDTDSDSDSEEESTESESGRSSCASQRLEALVDEKEEVKQQTPAEAESSERRVEAAAELAASIQPRGTTLELAEAGTVAPSLLRGSLREYQLVGLHWLATMHSRGLNGILADEMGLGKTIQTIALLAHLALSGDWGPHLVIAPTSVVLNWEMEFKKWCPAFKILTYYGTIKERKLKRVGWTKPNSFHVCITSYKLVVQDHQSFRRKRWKYLILDEAQNIKNFKSQRWQMLLNFQTDRRLLLTGTPLQNSLLELWSLMHFLMPAVFASHTEFREWFTPLAGAAEAAAGGGGADADPALVRRLHAVLRPFLLRRLKADVERQMPRKYEHVLLCRLAKRQRALYDDFMSRAKTRESLASGNLLSVINVLMQLRKVCNHPDLFEPRPVQSPLYLEPIQARIPSLLLLPSVLEREELSARLGGELASLEMSEAGAFAAHRARHLAPPRRLIEELPTKPLPPPAPKPPPARMRLHLRLVARAPHPTATRPPPPPLPPLTQPELDKESSPTPVDPDVKQSETSAAAARLLARRCSTAKRNAAVNERRCWRLPLYGKDLRDAVQASPPVPPPPLAPPDLAALLRIHNDAIEQFSVCWASARAPAPVLVTGGGAREWKRVTRIVEATAEKIARPLLALLHAPASRQSVAFPHPRLLQYDCGKLQTLAVLLRRLKSGGHRVLIFTQMTRVLDVLEGFLSLHGHAYLRLDGATRVDRRQPLVDRFNADPRLFAFILSTRSGGVGLNLTGADSVVFYDSDWNPTMDAQAQDRCHRIGQTRDVHVYRLVTAATVEENILRKAEQKRALGHLAIEDGHFTTSYLRADNLAELFGTATTNAQPAELESALLACEDEADAAAARAAKAETQKDLAEFDETVPLDDENAPNVSVVEKEESGDCEVLALMKQLSPVEAYAMRLVESGSAEAEKAALDDMRRQLKSWEQRRQELRESTPPPPPATPPIAELTYSGEEARIQVWTSEITENGPGVERMPVWAPPTPPSGTGDVYIERWARALYRSGAAPERLLPAPRAARSPRRATPRAARPPAAPLSLFERAAARARPRLRPHAPTHAPPPEWPAHEDAALRRALRLQRLPAEPPPALQPNWEWCADLLSDVTRSYRPPRAARDRHDALADPERARRKQKKRPRRREDEPPRPPPPLSKLDALREAAERRRAAPKRRYEEPPAAGARHAALLADLGVDYEAPPTPQEVASRRADRIAKEKLKAAPAGSAAPPPTPAPVPVAAAPAPARVVVAPAARARDPTLIYRQQALARQHLKILHHAPHTQSVVVSSEGVTSQAGSAAGTLRTLQLQQLALRRATPARLLPRLPHPQAATSHVVLAHLTPATHVTSHPAAHVTPHPAPQTSNEPDRQ